MKEDAVISLEGVSKTFRDFWLRPTVRAVDGLNLEVRRGEVFGLLGPNGSGKSTTIKMILGLLAPTAGRISMFGLSPQSVAARAKLGYLPELSYLHPFLTARETVRYYAGLSGLDRRTTRERTDDLLARMGLSAQANRAVGGFSKGMARKVAFAAALVAHPELLVLDEPTSGLDPLATRDVKELIRTLAADGMTILVTSHQLFDMQDVCSRVAILSQGRVVGGGTVADIVAKSADPRHALEDYFAAAVGATPEEKA